MRYKRAIVVLATFTYQVKLVQASFHLQAIVFVIGRLELIQTLQQVNLYTPLHLALEYKCQSVHRALCPANPLIFLTFVSLYFFRAVSTNSSDTGAWIPSRALALVSMRISFLSRMSENSSFGSSTSQGELKLIAVNHGCTALSSTDYALHFNLPFISTTSLRAATSLYSVEYSMPKCT